MTHTVIQAVTAVVNGYCELHGTSPEECGAAQELGKYAVLGLGAVGIVKALAQGHSNSNRK